MNWLKKNKDWIYSIILAILGGLTGYEYVAAPDPGDPIDPPIEEGQENDDGTTTVAWDCEVTFEIQIEVTGNGLPTYETTIPLIDPTVRVVHLLDKGEKVDTPPEIIDVKASPDLEGFDNVKGSSAVKLGVCKRAVRSG